MTDQPTTEAPDAGATPEPDAEGPKPKRTRRKRASSSSSRRPGRPSNHEERARKVQRLHEQYGDMCQFGGVMSPRLAAVGEALSNEAEDIGEAWATWADTSPRVATLIDNAAMFGGFVGVLAAYTAVAKAALAPIGEDAPAGGGMPVSLADLFRFASADVMTPDQPADEDAGGLGTVGYDEPPEQPSGQPTERVPFQT